MKHKLLLTFSLATLAFAGCTQDFDEPIPSVPTTDGLIAININGSIDQTYSTRVDDGGFCDGDQIGLYGVNYTDNNSVAGELLDEGNQVDNARYTFDEANWKWVSSGNIYYKDAETHIDLYGYYPYGSVNSVSEYAFEVEQDQSGGNAVDGYAMSDFLWGKTENVTPSENKVKIKFNHKMACANVILTEGDGFEIGEFERLEKGVLVMNTTRTSTIDLSTGEVTAVGDAPMEGIVMKNNAEGFRAIVVPQTVAAGKALFSITIDGIAYRFKKDIDFTYEQGKQSKFTIKINKKKHSGEYKFILTDTEIVDWIADLDSHGGEARQYYVVHCEEAGTLEEKILADKKNPAKIKNLKVSGKIYAADFTFMKEKMDILQSINLKETQIVGDPFVWKWEGTIDGEWKRISFTTEYPTSWDEADAQAKAKYPNSNIETNSYFRNTNYGKGNDEIPDLAFDGKYSLVNFVFPEKVTKIGGSAFNGTTLSGALIIPDDVVEIGYNTFQSTNISSLQLPVNLKIIETQAFRNCRSLAGSLVLPESLEYIGSHAFDECYMLSGTLTLPSKLTEISDRCFFGCPFTGDLVIPDGVKKISEFAFRGCMFNGQLTLGSQITKIDQCAFLACSFQGELIIPKAIQAIESSAFGNNGFSSILFEEGSELAKIGDRAFSGNGRLSESVIIPNGVITIGSEAFGGCGQLLSVVIPSTITTIGSSAFSGCHYITRMQCDATTPPVVGSGAFDGIGKENLTLEVPEQSVPLYQTANGWADFNRISAYYDFSISRKHIRTLNAEYSKEYMLRVPSGEAWKVESCPEWVTVTPSSGVGRTEVTITVSEMSRTTDTFTFEEMGTYGNWTTETHKGRAGEIVFLLESKDRRVTMDVQQYDSDRYDGEVITNQTATKGGGVNLVFMGDCFDARDIAMGSYLDGINEAIGYYFAIEPYKSYRDYFNVYTVLGMSDDSGMGTVNTVKDAKFGSQYSLEYITPDTEITYEYAMKAETVNEGNLNKTLVVMIENTENYGGICYMWGDGSAIAICPMSADAYPYDFRGIVQHEAGGHGFAKLADEYIYTHAFISVCGCSNPHLLNLYAGKSLGWHRNLSDNSDHKTVEWAHLFAHPDYMDKVDMYEGGYFHTRGIYRSEANSCMNNNVPYYSAISRQEMVERIMRYAGLEFSLEDFYANDVRDASNNDFTTRAKLSVEETPVMRTSAAKQMPPKFMGDKPRLKKSNK